MMTTSTSTITDYTGESWYDPSITGIWGIDPRILDDQHWWNGMAWNEKIAISIGKHFHGRKKGRKKEGKRVETASY